MSKPTVKYEGFLLMHEGDAPYDGGTPDRYTVPAEHGQALLGLPSGLFLNGWIHALEDSELAFIVMIACLRAAFGHKPIFAAGGIRLLQFGLGRDAYQAHHMLNQLDLLHVEEDPDRRIDGGKSVGPTRTTLPSSTGFQLLRDGFDAPAIPTMRSAIERRL